MCKLTLLRLFLSFTCLLGASPFSGYWGIFGSNKPNGPVKNYREYYDDGGNLHFLLDSNQNIQRITSDKMRGLTLFFTEQGKHVTHKFDYHRLPYYEEQVIWGEKGIFSIKSQYKSMSPELTNDSTLDDRWTLTTFEYDGKGLISCSTLWNTTPKSYRTPRFPKNSLKYTLWDQYNPAFFFINWYGRPVDKWKFSFDSLHRLKQLNGSYLGHSNFRIQYSKFKNNLPAQVVVYYHKIKVWDIELDYTFDNWKNWILLNAKVKFYGFRAEHHPPKIVDFIHRR